MKKPLIFIVIGGLVLGLIGAGVYLYFSQKKNSPAEVVVPSVSPTPAFTLLSWDDPAGFTMQYPDDVVINKYEEDVVNYAHVELTNVSHPGSVTIWVKDLPKSVTNTVSWGKLAATPSSAISFDTTVGGQPAQKILVSDTPKTVSVGVVYDGVLWTIEATLADDVYWQRVYDAVVQSFVFKPIAGQASDEGAQSAPVSDYAVDEEEVLE